MDFIKIPYYINEDRVGDAVIPICEISVIAAMINENEDVYSRIMFSGDKYLDSPMSVAEIYDLIKQNLNDNETSN